MREMIDNEVQMVLIEVSDYEEYEGAKGIARIHNGCLEILAECIDGITRRYRSTPVICVRDYKHETHGLCNFIRTQSGKVWLLS